MSTTPLPTWKGDAKTLRAKIATKKLSFDRRKKFMLQTHLQHTPDAKWVRNAEQKYEEFCNVRIELDNLIDLMLSIPEVMDTEYDPAALSKDKGTPAFFHTYYRDLADTIAEDDVEVQNALIAFIPNANTDTPGQPTNQPTPKARKELEPGTLEKGVSPARLEEWIADFWSYMKASNFLNELPAIQHRHLHGFLAENLWLAIKSDITVNMPLFPTDPDWTPSSKHPNEPTCIQLLTTTWAANQPVTTRRLKLFRHKQADGQAFSDYLAQHADLEVGCDLSTMTPEDMYVMTILSGCIDDALLDELLKINNGRPENRRQIAERTEQVEQRRATSAGILNPTSASAITNHQRRKQADMSPTNKPTTAQRNPQPLPLAVKGRCLTCGSRSHLRKFCPPDVREKVKCDHCNTQGNHDTDVCITHARNNPTTKETAATTSTSQPQNETQTVQAINPSHHTSGLIAGTFNPLDYI